MLGHDENVSVGVTREDFARGFDTAHLGHGHVHDDDVGMGLLVELDCLEAV